MKSDEMKNNAVPGPLGVWLWCAVVLVMAVFLVLGFRNAGVSSDVMELLPAVETRAGAPSETLVPRYAERLAERLVWVVRGDPAAARDLRAGLLGTGAFASIEGPVTEASRRDWYEGALKTRLATLPDESLLSDPARAARRVLSRVFSPVGAPSASELAADPLLLVRSAASGAGGFTVADDWIAVKDGEGTTWYVLSGTLKPGAASGMKAEGLVHAFDDVESSVAARHPGFTTARQGAVFYSAEAARTARSDMTRLGGLSIAALVALLWFAFRSLRPIALCLFSIAAGGIAGALATLWVFGSLHAVTLVMCLSLVGLCADYTTYYVSRRRFFGDVESPRGSLLVLRPSLLHAFISTAAAYGVMAAAPFPGLRQLAVFAVAGLSASWLTVYLCFPSWVRGLPVASNPSFPLLRRWYGFWSRSRVLPVVLIALVLAGLAAGAGTLRIDDDPAALQTPPAALKAADQRVSGLLGTDLSQTWFLVTAPDEDTLLERLGRTRMELSKWREEGLIRGFTAPTLVSKKRQEELLPAYGAAVEATVAGLARSGIVLPEGRPAPTPVGLDEWLSTPAGSAWRAFFMNDGHGRLSVLVPVSGVGLEPGDDARLASWAAANEGVEWINRRALWTKTFASARTELAWLIGGAWLLISAGLLFGFGPRRGAGASLAVLAALGAALAATGLLGLTVNIFSLFALILVLGVGVDYAVFFASRTGAPETTLFAMTVALLSTLFSLGVLVFSRTEAVSNFGLVLTVGVLTAYLLAPLSLFLEKKQ